MVSLVYYHCYHFEQCKRPNKQERIFVVLRRKICPVNAARVIPNTDNKVNAFHSLSASFKQKTWEERER